MKQTDDNGPIMHAQPPENEVLESQQGSHYADLHHSTNRPAPPLPVGPVQYATVKTTMC